MSTVVAPAPLKLARLRTPIVLIAIGCVIAFARLVSAARKRRL